MLADGRGRTDGQIRSDGVVVSVRPDGKRQRYPNSSPSSTLIQHDLKFNLRMIDVLAVGTLTSYCCALTRNGQPLHRLLEL